MSVPSPFFSNVTVTIEGNTYTLVTNDETTQGKFTLDPSKLPKHMDIQPSSGNDAGSTLPAIFECTADTFRVCHSRPGTARPDSFTALIARDISFAFLQY